MQILGFGIEQIAVFLLVLARVGGIFTSAPVFGGKLVAPKVRVLIAVSLTFIFTPMAHYSGNMELIPFAIAFLREVVIGLVIGFVAYLVFSAVEIAGSYLDMHIGLGFTAMVDPMTTNRTSALGRLFNLIGTLVLFAVNGHHLIIQGLAESFGILPLGETSINPEMTITMVSFFSVILLSAMKIVAPIAGVVFLTDVSLGVLARTVPQLNIFAVGFGMKMAAGITAVVIVIPVAVRVMTALFTSLHSDIIYMLKQLTI